MVSQFLSDFRRAPKAFKKKWICFHFRIGDLQGHSAAIRRNHGPKNTRGSASRDYLVDPIGIDLIADIQDVRNTGHRSFPNVPSLVCPLRSASGLDPSHWEVGGFERIFRRGSRKGIFKILWAVDGESTAHDERSNQRGQQDDTYHYGHFRFIEDAGVCGHCCHNESDLTAPDHAATNAETAHWPHTHAQSRHSAAEH